MLVQFAAAAGRARGKKRKAGSKVPIALEDSSRGGSGSDDCHPYTTSDYTEPRLCTYVYVFIEEFYCQLIDARLPALLECLPDRRPRGFKCSAAWYSLPPPPPRVFLQPERRPPLPPRTSSSPAT